ncbi:hypothetical protein Smp_149670 [Schistosoma mansoni]|uniref:hypothetical protein n=1 Tax=Schistosoma mansoni TaxID=6183 RepID=UPI00022C8675|nr:hypothetical protein Smp_149670 [Schistosoma mansoni]|eukprot:XP_018644244.1 hypothetical protein Smp_149670 [Schistosoma mansoni]
MISFYVILTFFSYDPYPIANVLRSGNHSRVRRTVGFRKVQDDVGDWVIFRAGNRSSLAVSVSGSSLLGTIFDARDRRDFFARVSGCDRPLWRMFFLLCRVWVGIFWTHLGLPCVNLCVDIFRAGNRSSLAVSASGSSLLGTIFDTRDRRDFFAPVSGCDRPLWRMFFLLCRVWVGIFWTQFFGPTFALIALHASTGYRHPGWWQMLLLHLPVILGCESEC